jgi:hypothetical protein
MHETVEVVEERGSRVVNEREGSDAWSNRAEQQAHTRNDAKLAEASSCDVEKV